jgi:tetratricopeptide (TPR) repeat protein
VEHLLGNYEVAAKALAQAVTLEPAHAEIRLHAAIVYATTGNRDAAEKELKEALRLNSSLEGRDEVRELRERIAALRPIKPRLHPY